MTDSPEEFNHWLVAAEVNISPVKALTIATRTRVYETIKLIKFWVWMDGNPHTLILNRHIFFDISKFGKSEN